MNERSLIIILSLSFFLFISCGRSLYEYDEYDTPIYIELKQKTNNDAFAYEGRIANHKIAPKKAYETVEKVFENKEIRDFNVVGNELLYIANFDNGWAIVAGDERVENTIIAYSDYGSFYPDSIDCPDVLYWYEMTKSGIENIKRLTEDSIEGVELARGGLPDIDYSQDYYWVDWKEKADTILTEWNIDHLVNTKWGQSSPWYRKCPVTSGGDTCVVGCVAVAAAQVLYYLRTEKGFPIDVNFHTSISSHQLSNGKYSVDITRSNSVYSSYWWAGMADNWYQQGTDNVAELLVDVGDYFEMEYSPTGSSASTSDCPDVFEDYYNVHCDIENYSANSYSHVKTSLLHGYPIIVRGGSSSGNHSWIIDGCRYTSRQIDQPYQWRMVATDSLNFYYSTRQIRYYYTESQMGILHPGVVEGDEFHEFSSISDINKYLRMNWGWNGSYDGGYYSFLPSDTLSYSPWLYQGNPKIVYNFSY